MKRKPTPSKIDCINLDDFLRDLEDNEEMMSEGAAMAVTCEQYGISVDDGTELLVRACEAEAAKA